MALNRNILLVGSLILFSVILLLVAIGSIVWSYIFSTVDAQLSSFDIPIGNTSWNESYAQYLQPTIVNAATVMPRAYSLSLSVGMIILMLLVAYWSGDKHRLWIILDILILIGAFIFAVQIREAYLEVLASYQPFYDIGTTIVYEASRFIMNLPITVTVIGVVMMLLTYGMKSFRAAAKPEEPYEYGEVTEEEY